MANNIDNLVSLADRTTEEKREIGIKGGKASGEARKQKKLIKDSIELLLGLPIKSNKIKQQLKELGIEDDEMNNQTAMVIAIYQKALKGDVSAFNTLRDSVGQGVVNKLAVEQVPTIKDDIK